MSATLADPLAARAHARAMEGIVVEAMPILPPRADDLPAGVAADDLVWEETIAGGGYASRFLARGTRLRLIDLKGDACASLLLFNAARRRLGYPYWSLSQWLKRQVKEAVKAIDRFEIALANEAKRRGLDGVVCGHIHHAEMRRVQGVLYMNDGDWVESCTALVEHADGRFELVDWVQENRLSFARAPRRRTFRSA